MIGTFDGPGLALYGGSDSRGDAAENAAALRRLAAKPGLEIEILPGLTPLFQPDPTGDPQITPATG